MGGRVRGSGILTFALLLSSALAGAAAAQESPEAPAPADTEEAPAEGEAEDPEETPEPRTPTAADALPPPPPREALDPEVLALCDSIDVAARRYCLRRIDEVGQPTPEVRATLMRLSSRDPDLHLLAHDTFRRLFATEPPPYQALDLERPAAEPAPEPEVPPGDPYRVVYAPTAWVRPAGTAAFNAFELGTFQVDFGIDDHVQLGFQTMLPIGVIAVGAAGRVGWEFEGGAVGVSANAIALIPFIDGGADPIFVYGGGPAVTLGSFERYANGGVLIYGVSSSEDDVVAVVPHVGGSLKLASRLKLNAELYSITLTNGDADFGELFLLMWGVRIFGDSLWGDIALIDPICEDCGEIYEVIPLGIPFLNVGASW